MNCIYHGREVELGTGTYRMCNKTNLPCPHKDMMAFSEETGIICDDPKGCFFAEEIIKVEEFKKMLIGTAWGG